ncbi:MAG TPA: M23 family metallopeptidase [Puia sp.]|nr:M23 family metallopeptidase [Puia sp.]
MRIFLPVLLCLLTIAVAALYIRSSHSGTYFREPLDISLQLAANFGELREDHFHMGLDIRTKGREGLPVYAAAGGYISHVKVALTGLGKALFVTHPNGRMTVYGHLERLTPELAAIIQQRQYAAESREQELDLPPGRFPVEKGQLIGYSGNTGSSLAPHLHFEVRDSHTGNNINPLPGDFTIPDDIPPVISGLYWYDRRSSTYMTRARKIKLTSKEGVSQVGESIVNCGSPLISMGIVATDKASNSPHVSGIFSAKVWLDGRLIYGYSLRELAESDSRYINACIDYPKWIRSGIYVQHLSILPGNHLAVYDPAGGDGLIRLSDSGVHRVRIRVSDVYSNYSDLDLRVQWTPGRNAENGTSLVRNAGEKDGDGNLQGEPARRQDIHLLSPGRASEIKDRNVRVRFSPRAFYDQVPFVLYEDDNRRNNNASLLVHLHDATIPVHDRYSVQVRTTLAPGDALRNKTVMQLVSGDSQLIVKGDWQGSWMGGSFNRLGNLQLLVDTTGPTVQASGWSEGAVFAGDAHCLSLLCKDDLGLVARFRAELDGHWLLFEQKGNLFWYDFDEHCSAGPHRLTVTVRDVAGNETRKDFTFVKR